MKTERRSAKTVITDYAIELQGRPNDPGSVQKLQAIEHIAYKMNWIDLYNRLRYAKPRETWWQK